MKNSLHQTAFLNAPESERIIPTSIFMICSFYLARWLCHFVSSRLVNSMLSTVDYHCGWTQSPWFLYWMCYIIMRLLKSCLFCYKLAEPLYTRLALPLSIILLCMLCHVDLHCIVGCIITERTFKLCSETSIVRKVSNHF